MTAREVAERTYQGMLERKALVIPGLSNRVIAQAHRFLPRQTLARLAKRMYLSRKH